MFGATSDDYIKSSSRSDGYWAARAPPAGPKQNTGMVPGGEASAATPRGRGSSLRRDAHPARPS